MSHVSALNILEFRWNLCPLNKHRKQMLTAFFSDLKLFTTDLQVPNTGYTVNCPGCNAAKADMPQKPHSPTCRERIRKALEQTDHGKRRIEAANQRFLKQCQQQLDKHEQEQNRHDTHTWRQKTIVDKDRWSRQVHRRVR